MSAPPGLERYQVLGTVGTNGLVTIYRALDRAQELEVVLKVCLHPDPTVHDRFLEATERAQRIEHDHLARVLDAGSCEARAYLAEEWLEGADLVSWIGQMEAADPVFVLRRLREIALGLAHAHANGLFHGDLRPTKIRWSKDERLKVLDLGIARMVRALTPLTREGPSSGVAGYLAPEGVLGRAPDLRVDVFAWGSIAYELLAGRRPFPGATIGEILANVLRRDPGPVSSAWADCPGEIDRLVERSLAKDPASRYASCGELLSDLDEAIGVVEARLAGPTMGDPSAQLSATKGGGARPAAARPGPTGGDARHGLAGRWIGAVRLLWQRAVAALAGARSRSTAGVVRARRWMREMGLGRRRVDAATTGPRTRAAMIAAGILVVAGGLIVQRLRSIEPAQAATTPVAPTIAPPPPAPEGRLVIDARPWGEIVRLTPAAGGEMPIGARSASPLSLTLPVGAYEVEIRNPNAPEPLRCTVEITPDVPQACVVTFAQITGVDYFKQSGWWR